MVRTTPAAFSVGDFVEVLCHLDLIRDDKKGQGMDEVRVGLALEEVTRLFNADQMKVSTSHESCYNVLTLQTIGRPSFGCFTLPNTPTGFRQ